MLQGMATNAAEYAQWIDIGRQRWNLFADAVRWIKRDLPVPSCPGWTLTDLVDHVGNLPAWVKAGLALGERAPMPSVHSDTPGEWLADEAAALFDDLAAWEYDTPAWVLWGAQVTAFWPRRLTHEIVIHHYDLALTLTNDTSSLWQVPDWLAADGVAEAALGNWPRQIAHGRSQALPQTLHLALRSTPELPSRTYTILGSDPQAGEITVSGTPVELYLGVWGRGRDLGLPPMTS